jgi:hypothetical protein
MAALVAAIHALNRREDVDPRDKPGDDVKRLLGLSLASLR